QLRPVDAEKKEPEEEDKETDSRVHEALSTFKQELQKNIRSSMNNTDPEGHIRKVLKLKESDLDKVKLLANVGVTQAADSLSKIIGTRIDMAIPDVRLLPVSKVATTVGNADEIFLSVSMGLVGDVNGDVLFSIPESSGLHLIDDLYNLESGETQEINEDGISALKEITNIVGSSVINAISERTGLSILTKVPEFEHGIIGKIVQSVFSSYNIKKDYALTMDTEFYYEDDRVMGHLLVIPRTSSLRRLIDNLRDNG
ncbi:MAG: chemotaxis protein CheC, partial [Spirochaetota bacterium]